MGRCGGGVLTWLDAAQPAPSAAMFVGVGVRAAGAGERSGAAGEALVEGRSHTTDR